jgi:hypothetical protein
MHRILLGCAAVGLVGACSMGGPPAPLTPQDLAMVQTIAADQEHQQAVLAAARDMLGRQPGGCAAPQLRTITEVSPERLPRSNPVGGGSLAWISTVGVAGCGRWTQQRALSIHDGARGTRVFGLPHGDSRANGTLSSDVFPIFAQLATAAVPGCRAPPQILDTRLPDGPHAAGQPWREIWTAGLCGSSVDVRFAFTPSPRGGTDITAGLANR